MGVGYRRWRRRLTLLSALLLVAAGSPARDDPADSGGLALERGAWQLDAYRTVTGLRPAVYDVGNGYALFEDGRFRLNAGCGTLRGRYWLGGDQLIFSPPIGSMVANCPDTLVAQEAAVLALLRVVEGVERNGDDLSLVDAEGNRLLRLVRPLELPLQGRRWRLSAYRNAAGVVVKALPSPAFTLVFENAEQLVGHACASYRASYRRDDQALRLDGPVAVIHDACRTLPKAQVQGADYLAALDAVRGYRVYERLLLLRDEKGRMLASFEAMDLAADGAGSDPSRDDNLPAAPEPLLPQLR